MYLQHPTNPTFTAPACQAACLLALPSSSKTLPAISCQSNPDQLLKFYTQCNSKSTCPKESDRRQTRELLKTIDTIIRNMKCNYLKPVIKDEVVVLEADEVEENLLKAGVLRQPDCLEGTGDCGGERAVLKRGGLEGRAESDLVDSEGAILSTVSRTTMREL